MVSVAFPVLVTVKTCVPDDPVATLPNDPLAPPTAIVVVIVGSVALAPVMPIQPACPIPANSAANNKKVKGLIRFGRGRPRCEFLLERASIEKNR